MSITMAPTNGAAYSRSHQNSSSQMAVEVCVQGYVSIRDVPPLRSWTRTEFPPVQEALSRYLALALGRTAVLASTVQVYHKNGTAFVIVGIVVRCGVEHNLAVLGREVGDSVIGWLEEEGAQLPAGRLVVYFQQVWHILLLLTFVECIVSCLRGMLTF